MALAAVVCGKGLLEGMLSRKVGAWLHDNPQVFTSQLTDEQQASFVSALGDFAAENDLIAIGQGIKHQAGMTLFTFGVLASAGTNDVDLEPLAVLGNTVVDKALVQEVLSAPDADAYAGYGNNALGCVRQLPAVRAGVSFRVERLGPAGELGDTLRIIGLDDLRFQELVGRLADATGASEETLTTKMSGSSSELGLVYVFAGGAFVLLSIMLGLLMVTGALLELKTLGVYLMLGWSKGDFIWKLSSSQLIGALVVIPVSAAGAALTLDGFILTADVALYTLATMVPTVVAVLVSAGVGALPLALAAPVGAIAGRYSRRGFYVLTVSVYLACLGAVFSGCLYIDQPLRMYAESIRTQAAWGAYEDWSVVQDFRLDGVRFTGNPMDLAEDFYAWYAAHEHDDGVYLANTSFYQEDTIRAYLDAEGSGAPAPFWYLAASPSYLRNIGIELSAEELALAEAGTRVYLLPESLDDGKTDVMQRFLVEKDAPFDSNIVTPFMEDPTYRFSTYDDAQGVFTWSTDAEQPPAATGVVIAVVTANNMVPFESESLVASGLENSYVKLDPAAAEALLGEGGTADFAGSLAARFTTVGNYIDGLQKSLEELFALFSVVLAMMVAAIAVMVGCLVEVVNRMRSREVGARYVLGFSAADIYRREAVLVNAVTLVGVAVSAALSSNAGLLVGAALLVISNAVLFWVARRQSAGVVLELVTKEQ